MVVWVDNNNNMGKWSDDSACSVVHDVRLYNVLDTVVVSGEYVCCSVAFVVVWCLALWLVCLVLCGLRC